MSHAPVGRVISFVAVKKAVLVQRFAPIENGTGWLAQLGRVPVLACHPYTLSRDLRSSVDSQNSSFQFQNHFHIIYTGPSA